MADKRQIEVTLSGKETFSPAAKKAADAAERFGDKTEEAARDAKKLDGEIEDLNRDLVALAGAYAAAGSAAERSDIFKQIRGKQSELRKSMNIRKLMVDVGGEAAEGFSISFMQKIGPLLARAPMAGMNPAVLAIGAPIAVGVAAMVGAAVSGAIIGGVGIGGVAGGLAIAAKNSTVRASAKGLGDEIGQQLEKAAEPFVPAALAAIGIVRREFRKASGDIEGIFSSSSRYVGPLTEGLSRGVAEVISGVRVLADRAGPVIDQIAEGMLRLGKAVGDGLESLGDNADSAGRALGIFFATLDAGIRTVFATINGLTELYELMELGGAILTHNTAQVHALRQGGDGMVKVLKPMTDATAALNTEFATATDVARSFRESLDQLTGAALSVEQAEINWGESVRTTTAAIRENNKEIKNKNERDLANRQLLVDMANVGRQRTQAIYEETIATQGAEAAEREANRVYAETRSRLVAAATAYLGTAAAAEAYVTEVLGIPPSRTTKVTADTASAEHKIRTLKDLIAAIKSKTVVITATGVRAEGRNVPIGELGGRAAGGPVRKGQAYVVGEKRAEVFVPDRDGTIIPSIERFDRMTGRAGGGSGAAINLHVNFSGPVGSQMELRDWLARSVDELKRRGRF